MPNAIEISNLTKKFGQFVALDQFNLAVEEGSVHGFLGPNGAGKSTTIRTLLGVLHPTSGTVRVLGVDPRTNPEVLKKVGYVPGDVALWPNLTGKETLRALERLRGGGVDHDREHQLIDAFQLDTSKKVKDYSTGNRRKVSLVAALSIDASLLILDEPTAGLDPLMENVFIECIGKAHDAGTTVLLSSHIMSEVERLCEHVTVIRDGKAVEQGSITQLRHLAAYDISAQLPQPTEDFPATDFRTTVAREEVPEVLRRLLAASATDITSAPASLEKIFLSHYGAGSTKAASAHAGSTHAGGRK